MFNYHILFLPKDAFMSVAAKILDCARNMAIRAQRNINTKVLSMHGELVVTRASEDEDEDDSGNYDNDYGDGLEMVRVEEREGKECPICFEDFYVGVQMSCLHKF